MKKIAILVACASLFYVSGAHAQIPAEVVVGHKKASYDLMFFKFFKNGKGENSRFLFFNRARSTVDYKMTNTTNLPSFGLTQAFSYNHPSVKGFAPVFVCQILNRGFFKKAGIQFAHIRKNMTIFTWFVSELSREPDLDYFLLARFTPPISSHLNAYCQVESSNAFPTSKNKSYNFTQRIRLGLMLKSYQFGAAADFNQMGNQKFIKTHNIGGFVRHEF